MTFDHDADFANKDEADLRTSIRVIAQLVASYKLLVTEQEAEVAKLQQAQEYLLDLRRSLEFQQAELQAAEAALSRIGERA